MSIKGGAMQHDKYKFDAGKPQLRLVPTDILVAIARIREYGNRKYDADSWKLVPNAKERYTDALLRHIKEFVDDPTGFDEESGLPHLWHAACNIAFLCYFYKEDFINGIKTISKRGRSKTNKT